MFCHLLDLPISKESLVRYINIKTAGKCEKSYDMGEILRILDTLDYKNIKDLDNIEGSRYSLGFSGEFLSHGMSLDISLRSNSSDDKPNKKYTLDYKNIKDLDNIVDETFLKSLSETNISLTIDKIVRYHLFAHPATQARPLKD